MEKSLTDELLKNPNYEALVDKKSKSLTIISGGSGTGKTSVVNLLTQWKGGKEADLIRKIITSTTRKPRPGEVDKIDYYFITKETFQQELDKGNFLEWTIYNGNYYGIHGDAINFILKNKNKHGVVVVDVKGMKVLKSYCKKNNFLCYTFWFQAPSLASTIKNLRKRNTSDKNIIEALIIEEEQAREAYNNYDYTLIVNNLEETAKKITDKI